MKHFITLLLITICYNFSQAQCTDLFISEYVEGWSNNKALEIYNPTNLAIDMSSYSVSRYTNGATQASTPLQLEGIIEPYSTFVIGLDKRDPEGTGYDAPVWDGYYTYTDSVTNEEVTIYDADTDLQSKIDFWANGTYYGGTDPDSAAMYPMTMFFNGNDAITLEMIGGVVVDLIGKVGDDPGAGWTDANGAIWTKDHTLVRIETVTEGVNSNPTIFDPTLQWDSLPVNTFANLGSHDCICNLASQLEEIDTGFLIYPNPTSSNSLSIKNTLNISDVKVFNPQGKLILHKSEHYHNQMEINLPDVSGLYIITLTDANGTRSKSIVLE